MSEDSSFVGAFDLKSQSGVMSVLAAIRASEISASDKNDLRDLVFSYTNGGGDASVRIALEQKLAAHHIIPVVVQKSGKAAPVPPFGTYRPTPNFKAPNVASVTVPTPAVSAPAPQVTVVTEPEPLPAVPPVVTVPPPPVAEPQTVAAPSAAPVEQTVPTPVPATSVNSNEATYLDRIRQIKTAVNSQVGNPVNLVDINNEVGREYMNALLEAMKKLGSGAVSEMGPAMNRLEAAYAAVEIAIKDHKATPPPVSEPIPNPTPTPMVPPATPVAAVAIENEPISIPEIKPLPVRQYEEAAPVTPVAVPPVADTRVPMVDVVVPQPPKMAPLPPTDLETSGYENPPPPIGGVVTSAPSLADSDRILTPKDLKDATTLETGAKGDTLYTKEIDDGLNQLLSDWSLFKKSGLFGTGPNGREHPLYKKISGLQVPLLLAGRFDGATQEIRQSITDYMNGWRYEQGIIYQPGETFEIYLRRVIRHILDLQKKRH